MSLTLDIIQAAIAPWAQTEPLIRCAYLFGSRARGTHRPDSDVDVAILHALDPDVLRQCRGHLSSARTKTWSDHCGRWRADLAARFDVPVDIQPIRRDDQRIRPAVKREGVALYKRRAHPPGRSCLF